MLAQIKWRAEVDRGGRGCIPHCQYCATPYKLCKMADNVPTGFSSISNSFLAFSLVYWLIVAMEVTGMIPQEFRSVGLHLQGILDSFSWFGHEDIHFVRYQVTRTTTMLALHSLLPAVYAIAFSIVCPTWLGTWYVQGMLGAMVVATVVGWARSYLWYRKGWKNHPLIRDLSNCHEPISHVIADLNAQVRAMDNYKIKLGAHCVMVTDSWILKVSPHSVQALPQYEAEFNIANTDEHLLSVEGPGTAQYLTIQVISRNANIKSFSLRLNALSYPEFKDKVTAPVKAARCVVIKQNLSEQFVDAFEAQVNHNPPYSLPANSSSLEACIGCLQIRSDVKLVKECSEETMGPCRMCHCRPMWCLRCMAKWFASRQDQGHPQSWMAGTAPCPMCRAKFCVLDVAKVT